MRRRRFGCALALALLASGAQAAAPVLAVPFYRPDHVMQGLHQHWYGPRARGFAAASDALVNALDALCAATPPATAALARARHAWRSAASAWDTLSAVAIGPLLTRRSVIRLDFWPARPRSIERAIRAAPADAAAMERVGTPAKGFAGLEWLLWTRPLAPGTPACRYALQVAREIASEAQALAAAFAALAARDWRAEEAGAVAAMDEWLNQWIGGLERLRWTHMEKPVLSARTEPGISTRPEHPRSASASAAQSWADRWRALATQAVAGGAPAPPPGQGLVPLETYLRGRGLLSLADRVEGSVTEAARALAQADARDAERTLAAARELAALKRLVETDVAPALDIHIGFSDADGD